MAKRTFAQEFNSRLGNYTGNRQREFNPASTDVDEDARAYNNAVTETLAKMIEQEEERRKKVKKGGKAAEEVYPGMSKPKLDRLVEQKQDNFLEDGWDFLGKVRNAPGVKQGVDAAKFVNIDAPLHIGKTALDAISRPSYGLFNALEDQANATMSREGLTEEELADLERSGELKEIKGDDFWHSFDDFAEGAWEGLKGDEKTGFGDIVEAQGRHNTRGGMPINPFNAFNGLNQAEAAMGPDGNKNPVTWTKRGLGLGGELLADPMNAVGVGVAGKIASKADNASRLAGKADDFSEDGFRNLVTDSTNRAIESRGLGKPFRDKKMTSWLNPNPPSLQQPRLTGNRPVGWDELHRTISDAIDNVTLKINGGATEGRVLGGQVAPYTVSQRVAESVRGTLLGKFDVNAARFQAHLDGTSRLSVAQINTLKQDPVFAKFHDELLAAVNANRTKNKFKTLDDAINHYSMNGTQWNSHVNKAMDTAKAQFDATVKAIQDDIYTDIAGKVYNAPGIKIMGKQVTSFNRIGKAYAGAKAGKLDTAAANAYSFGKQFPGRTALMNQRLRSLGVRNYENFKETVVQTADGLSKDQRKEITQALLDGRNFSDPKMQAAKDFIEKAYRDIFAEEVDAGVRAASSVQADNYVYLYYKHGKKGTIDNVRSTVKNNIASRQGLPPSILKDSKLQGLRPEEDAFRALLYKKLDSNRKMAKSWFTEDLLDHYGVLSNRLSTGSKLDRKLVAINDNIPKHIRAGMKPGDNWYLPQDIKEIYDNYSKLMRAGSNDEATEFIRTLDRLTRMFKTWTTIPYPGFHIRNSIGDIYMAHFDGVKFADYNQIRKLKSLAAEGKTAQLLIGGKNFTYEELLDLFSKNASTGGFQKADLYDDSITSKLNPNRLGAKVRETSEHREDFFRFTHFVKALKEEYPAAGKATRDPNKRLRNAVEAATYRVNKYLFDYGALTPKERNVLRRVIPFYTYQRKALPALIEAMFLRPAQMAKTNRLFIDTDDGSYQDMLIPDYIREYGYARLNDEESENPWVLGAQGWLPTDVVNRNLNLTSQKGFFANLLAQSNPVAKMPVELATGKKLFNDAPIESTRNYYAESFFPPAAPIKDALGLGSKQGWERVLAGRFGLGLPFDQITDKQEAASAYGIQEELFNKLSKINKKLADNEMKIYLSGRKDGASYRVKDTLTDKVLFESEDPKKVVEWAQKQT
jgi:hypothetical protein